MHIVNSKYRHLLLFKSFWYWLLMPKYKFKHWSSDFSLKISKLNYWSLKNEEDKVGLLDLVLLD